MARGRRWSRGGDRYDRYGGYGGWAPYVPVAERRAQAAACAQSLEKQRGGKLAPVNIAGNKIASTFWGQAWCSNLEAYSDFSNRLPRGRTYVRNGSVIDLQIERGRITALVSGSEVYELDIEIDVLPAKAWRSIQQDCARSVASLIDLLQGRFDRGVMERLTRPADGLFPKPREIRMQCSCPDSARLCKHLAAVLYGVGARLDQSPELLFALRNVDHLELIGQAVAAENLDTALAGGTESLLDSGDLGDVFGIELESIGGAASGTGPRPSGKPRRAAAASRQPAPRRSPATTNQPAQIPPKPKRGRVAVAAEVATQTSPKPRKQRKAATASVNATEAGQAQAIAAPARRSSRRTRAK